MTESIVTLAIAFAPIASDATAAETQTPTFLDGLILNLLNPKLYAGFFVSWLAIGSSIQRIFAYPGYARPVRILFGLSIVVVTAWALLR